MYYVSYLHSAPSGRYRVERAFDTREAAQEMIDVNAMVCPLPGVRLVMQSAEALSELAQRGIGADEASGMLAAAFVAFEEAPTIFDRWAGVSAAGHPEVVCYGKDEFEITKGA